jgi:hypothetical protein
VLDAERGVEVAMQSIDFNGLVEPRLRRSLELGWMLGAALSVSACAGGDHPLFQHGQGGGSGSSGATTSGNGTSGGTTGGNGGGATTGAGSGTTTTGAGTTTAASSSSSSGTTCQYPAGAYGIDQGTTVDPTLVWQGFPAGAQQPSAIAVTQYFDCNGANGINALLIDVSATWCGACQTEAMDIAQLAGTTWSAEGIRVLTLMIEDDTQNPATIDTAKQWRDAFGLTSSAVAADPNATFVPPSAGLPMQVVVDPRTMKIVFVDQGYSGDYSTLEGLAMSNKH